MKYIIGVLLIVIIGFGISCGVLALQKASLKTELSKKETELAVKENEIIKIMAALNNQTLKNENFRKSAEEAERALKKDYESIKKKYDWLRKNIPPTSTCEETLKEIVTAQEAFCNEI